MSAVFVLRRRSLLLVSLVLLFFPGGALCAQHIRVLAIGQVLPNVCPLARWFDADPLVDYTLVATDLEWRGSGLDVKRYVRLYFPKTRKALIEDFDFFVFPDGNIDPFTPRQIADMKYAMENGLGSFLTTGGDLSSPSGSAYPGWKNSVLEGILPIELNSKMKQDRSLYGIRVVKDDPPVLSMLVPVGIEKVRGWDAFTYLTRRSGATVWAKLVAPSLPPGISGDWLVSWRVGPRGGVFWVAADDLDTSWWSPVMHPCKNEYAMDVFMNILIYSTGRPLPPDIAIVHRLRQFYWQYDQRKVVLLSLVDFIDGFGANTLPLEREIDDMNHLKGQSSEAYLNQRYEEASAIMAKVFERIGRLEEDAMRLKDRALLWVYVTEWSAVTGTLFISGLVLYSLLVKRRLYREVRVTRSTDWG